MLCLFHVQRQHKNVVQNFSVLYFAAFEQVRYTKHKNKAFAGWHCRNTRTATNFSESLTWIVALCQIQILCRDPTQSTSWE